MTRLKLNKLNLIATFAIACIALAYQTTGAYAQSQSRIVLDPGTVIPVTLNSELSSNGSSDGDTFTADVDSSRSGYGLFEGAVVDGVVRHAVPQQGHDPGTLRLAFTRLRMADGTSYPIEATPTSLDTKDLNQRNDGVLVAKNTKKNQSLTYAGIGAGAGALIGLLNGKVRIENILIGGGLGYAAGELLKHPEQVHDVDLKSGTPMGVLVGRRVLYHRQIRTITSDTGSSLKYYWYNGQRWAFDPSTGARFVVGQPAPNYHRANRKYYSYQGHPYFLDLTTGERVRLN